MRILGIGFVGLKKGISHPQQVTDCFFWFIHYKIYISKTNIFHHILINHANSHWRMDTHIHKHWHEKVPQQWRQYNLSTHQCSNTNISSVTSTDINKSISKAKIINDSRRGAIVHFQLPQLPQYLHSRIPNKKTIVKLGLMCPRTYSLNPTVISLLFEYAQNGCADEYGEC